MPRPPAPCGTETAYRRHLREQKRGGPGPCPACLEAHREHVGERRDAAKRAKTAQVPEDLAPAPPLDERPAPRGSTRLDDLRTVRDTLRQAIDQQARVDVSKLHNLSKELREVLREIESIEGEQQSGGADGFDAFLAGGFDLGNVSRFPTPEDRQTA